MQLYRIKNKTNVNRSISNFLLQPYKEITIDEKTFEFQRNGLERWEDKGYISITTIKTLRQVIQKEIPQVKNEIIDLRANVTEEKVDTKSETSKMVEESNPEEVSEKINTKPKSEPKTEKPIKEEPGIPIEEKTVVDEEIPDKNEISREEIIKLAKIGICAICQKHFKNEKGVWTHLRAKHQIKKNLPNDL